MHMLSQQLIDRQVVTAMLCCRYYGYRLADAFDEDPRLHALDASWFTGKSVLDIGCNEGVLSLSLACKFGTKAMHGLDIDGGLIGKAARAVASLRTQLTAQLKEPVLGAACVSPGLRLPGCLPAVFCHAVGEERMLRICTVRAPHASVQRRRRAA
jgi:Ribosomal protein L11 methyltransferase (PrmA)